MIVNYTNHHKLKTHYKVPPTVSIKYSLAFVSLISPGNMLNIRLAFRGLTSPKKKLVVKQSYLLLAWAYYLSRSNNKFFKKPSLSIKPVKQSKFTALKAPMAHKTFSQEQY